MSEICSHPLANLFPLMDEGALEDLASDLRANGQRELIVTLDGMILDGRNRYRACQTAGIAPGFREFGSDPSDGNDPLAFVLSKNVQRRHLNEAQRASVAAKIANLADGVRSDRSANLPTLPVTQAAAARMLKISERTLRMAKRVHEVGDEELRAALDGGAIATSIAAEMAELPLDEQRRILSATGPDLSRYARTRVKKLRREARERELGAKQQALPEAKFGVIVADPEWRFEPWSRETGMNRAADNHYPTSEVEAIASRDVASIAADDCVLFLWATAPMLPAALEVMQAWGFAYKTHLIWRKPVPGTGFWLRSWHELLLIGTRGRVPAPTPSTQPASVIEAPRPGPHSAKPEEFLELIERWYPTMPKIELNRRGPPRPGWKAWGNEAENDSADKDYSDKDSTCHGMPAEGDCEMPVRPTG
jgi:N6-adenosine-specific RNA methylase IME4